MVDPPYFKSPDEMASFLQQLETSDSEAVRAALLRGSYTGARKHRATIWLRVKDAEATSRREGEQRSDRQIELALSREANVIAREAAERADTANAIATAALIVALAGTSIAVVIAFVT